MSENHESINARFTPREAVERLKEGNKRFIDAAYGFNQLDGSVRGHQMMLTQQPFAIILGCADSRVPAEIVFDQGLGDLFVIRVAGNIVAPSGIGSVEFAVEQFGTNLVVVLGHSRCGAVDATVDAILSPSSLSPNLESIVNRIKPSVESLVRTENELTREELIQRAVRVNVEASVAALSAGSQIIEEYIQYGELQVVGAEYSVETGEVFFFD